MGWDVWHKANHSGVTAAVKNWSVFSSFPFQNISVGMESSWKIINHIHSENIVNLNTADPDFPGQNTYKIHVDAFKISQSELIFDLKINKFSIIT